MTYITETLQDIIYGYPYFHFLLMYEYARAVKALCRRIDLE